MTRQRVHRLIIAILFLCPISFSFATEIPHPTDPNRYLNAVCKFSDNVLKYGRDKYGPKYTPLFVDGLNIHTHEPVKWIAPNGNRRILSNLAFQQNLFRALDSLMRITGNLKYKHAAKRAIRHALDHDRTL